MHTDSHPLAGQTIKVDFGTTGGNIQGVQEYAMRSGVAGLPVDNEVVYGKVGAFGHLAHVSEIVQ
jgi:hypothetical protein